MYGHHVFACGGVQYLYENNIRIPEDISVAMIGVPKWSQVSIPRFACVRQPLDEIGELAAKMLFDKLLNSGEREYEDGAQFILDSELLSGGSVKNLKA
jgi:DNA-binding LacI/PurR family transcriptional regulator